MTATEIEITSEEQRPERAVVVRTFAAELAAGDGRTVHLRIVPFGQRGLAADGLGGVPKGVPYQEEWMPGVFDKQLSAANRVLLNFEHQDGIGGVVGHGIELRQERDGYHGAFRIHDSADGDKALMLVNEGVLGGASLEAYPQKSVRTAEGIVRRVKAHLDKVALCRQPAFKDAVVLAVREETVFDEELLPVEIDPELVERCRKLGIALPERMAHPEGPGTPAQTGTPEDGTRPDTANSQEEDNAR